MKQGLLPLACPKCGQLLPRKVAVEGLTHIQTNIMEALVEAGPIGLRSDRLCFKVYADRIDGGPLGAMNSMRTIICYLNKKLEKRGLRIVNEHRGGGEFANYKLIDLLEVSADA